MDVATRLRHIHREYYELKDKVDQVDFDKAWKKRRIEVGKEVGLERQSFGAHLTLAVRGGKTGSR